MSIINTTVQKARTTRVVASWLLSVMLIVLFGGCQATGKSTELSISTTETTESTDTSYSRLKGVVINGREDNTPSETIVRPSKQTETTVPTETSAEETPTATTVPTETTNPVIPTKVPAKKKAVAPKTTKKKTTKKKTKKKSTKKPSATSKPNQYTYCTCDAKVNYGVSGMGSTGTHTFTGLTAQKNTNGTWKLTSASVNTITTWLNKNVKDKVGKPNWGSYSTTITNMRNYR